MRTYRKRPVELRHCVHCHTPFESNHKRRIYCGNSCSTLAYYARKAQATATTLAAPLPVPATQAPVVGAAPAPLTLAFNAQNLALLTAAPLLAEGVKKVVKFISQRPTLPGPSTWLPALFQLVKQPLVSLQVAEWEEPRFFVPVPWEGEVFYYRAAQDLLFWQTPTGQVHPLTHQHEFTQLLGQLRLQRLVQRHVPQLDYRVSLPALGYPQNLG